MSLAALVGPTLLHLGAAEWGRLRRQMSDNVHLLAQVHLKERAQIGRRAGSPKTSSSLSGAKFNLFASPRWRARDGQFNYAHCVYNFCCFKGAREWRERERER